MNEMVEYLGSVGATSHQYMID